MGGKQEEDEEEEEEEEGAKKRRLLWGREKAVSPARKKMFCGMTLRTRASLVVSRSAEDGSVREELSLLTGKMIAPIGKRLLDGACVLSLE